MPIHTPVHPGEFILEEIVKGHGLTIAAAADRLGVSRSALSNVLRGRTSLQSDLALRVEKAFKVSSATLMRMQAAYETAQAEKSRRR